MNIPLVVASSALAGSLAYGSQKGREMSETVQNLRNDTTSSFRNVRDSVLAVDRKAQSQIDALKSAVPKVSSTQITAGDLINFDAQGQLADSGFRINDSSPPNSQVLWTSNKIPQLLGTAGHIPLFDGLGNAADYGLKLDDRSRPRRNVIYSSEKLTNDIQKAIGSASNKMNLVPNAKLDTLASFDANGQVQSTNIVANDIGKLASGVANGIPGNLPVFNPDGNGLVDSLQTPTLFMKNSVPIREYNLACLNKSGQVQDSTFHVDNAAISPNTLWTSDVLNSNFMQAQKGFGLAQLGQDGQLHDSALKPEDILISCKTCTPGNLSTVNEFGQVADSSYYIQDSSAPAIDILWSSDKVDNVFMKKTFGDDSLAVLTSAGNLTPSGLSPFDLVTKVSGKQGNLISLGPFSKLQDSLVRIEDTEIPDQNTLWSSSKNDEIYLKRLKGSNLAQLGFDGQLHNSGIDPNTLLTAAVPSLPNSIAFLSASGNVKDSEITINDTAQPSPNILWTSNKMASSFKGSGLAQMTIDGSTLHDTGIDPTNILQKVQNGTSGNFSAIDGSDGTIYDSGYSVRDLSPSNVNVLWSSSKIDTDYVKKLAGNYTIPYISPDGQFTDSLQSLNNYTKILVPSKENDLASLDANGQLQDSMHRIDNMSFGSDILWSSSKIDNDYLKKSPNAASNNIALFDSNQQVQDLGFQINDTTSPGDNILWSSQKISSLLSSTVDDVSPSSTNTIWSSSKIDSNFVHKPSSSTPMNLALFDGEGNIQDASFSIDDTLPPSPKLLWTSQKIVPRINPSTLGNIATLNSDGTLLDSGFNVNDEATSVNNIWSSQKIGNVYIPKIPNAIQNDFAIAQSDGTLKDSGVSIGTTIGSNIIWTSDTVSNMIKSSTTKVPAAEGNLASLTFDGTIQDSLYSVNDVANADSKILWSSYKTDNEYVKKVAGDSTIAILGSNGQLSDSKISATSVQTKIIPSAAGNLATLSADGSLSDSTTTINDVSAATPNILWSSAKNDASYVKQVNTSTNLAQLGTDGQLHDSGLSIPDVMTKIFPSNNGNLASLNLDGKVQDSGFLINDGVSVGPNIVWSTVKNDATFVKQFAGNSTIAILGLDGQLHDSGQETNSFIKKTVPNSPGSLGALDANGQIIDSSYIVSDNSFPSVSVLWTSDKINNNYIKKLTGSNLAQLGDDGQLRDSMVNVNNITLKSVPAIPGTIATLDSFGQTNDSGFIVNDAVAAAPTVLWTSVKVDAKANKVIPTTVNDLAGIDALGQYQDSGYIVNDAVAASPSVMWTSAKISALTTKIFVAGSFNSDNYGSNTSKSMLATATYNPGGYFSANAFRSPKAAVYTVSAAVGVTDGQIAGSEFIQVNIRTSGGADYAFRSSYSAATALVLSTSGTCTLRVLSDETIYFVFVNMTGLGKAVYLPGTISFFTIIEQ